MSAWLERSQLSVPASNWRMIEKGVAGAADVAFLDLEDAVPPARKAEARQNVIRAMRELEWGKKPRAYRINGLDTPFWYRDVIEVVEAVFDLRLRPQGGQVGVWEERNKVDRVRRGLVETLPSRFLLIIVPKVGRAADLYALDTLLASVVAKYFGGAGGFPIRLEAQIESAAGLVNVERIARARSRRMGQILLQGLIFGPGDFAASARMPAASIGSRDGWDAAYPGHRFHYPMARIAVAARAAGLGAIDGPVADFRDLDAFRQACLVARGLGYDGKWCIHPSQIPIANEVFSPTEEEIAWARRVVEAYRQARAAGEGAISLDGTMIDAASIALAETTLDRAQLTGASG